jgi:hypothetical protein
MEASLAALWQVHMSELPTASGSPASNEASQVLIDRVLARVHDAAVALDRRPRAQRRSRRSDSQARSLRVVFTDMGDTYRAYRRRTGEPVSDEIRAAADRFRKERNVAALVSVAASLNRLEILPW